jgi:hypothetical protein
MFYASQASGVHRIFFFWRTFMWHESGLYAQTVDGQCMLAPLILFFFPNLDEMIAAGP